MTELSIRPDTPTLDVYASVSFDRIAAWAKAAKAAHEIATSLVQTSFVPEAFRGKAGEATAAILAGAEIGLDPMAALRSFDIIQGTAAPRANTLRAVVQAAGHTIVLTESTATRAVVRGRRRGEVDWQTSTWTMDRAKQLGLTGKKNWQAQPQAMLVARATSECARLVASDAILGIAYSSEELDDEGVVTPDVVAETKPARRTAQRALRPVPTPAPEPDFDEPAETVEMTDLITKPQQAKLHASLNELGYGNRDAGLAEIGRILDRDVDTTKTLTVADAAAVIDDLDAQILARRAPDEPTFDDGWPDTAAIPDDRDGAV